MNIVYEWIINELKTLEDQCYMDSYRLYKKLNSVNKDFCLYITIEPNQYKCLNNMMYKKNRLLTEMPLNTTYHPHSYCPINTLHPVLEMRIRSATVYQCGKCYSILVPRRFY